MRTQESRSYYARCVQLGCDKTWSGKTPKAINKAQAAARSHCQQSGHRVKSTTVRKATHTGAKRKGAK